MHSYTGSVVPQEMIDKVQQKITTAIEQAEGNHSNRNSIEFQEEMKLLLKLVQIFSMKF
jgi:hypothetical protein